MHKLLFVLAVFLCCACSSAKPVDNPTAENPIVQPQPENDSNPSPAPTVNDKMNDSENAVDNWNNPLQHSFVMRKSDESTQIIEFARSHSKAESLVTRDKLGNLAFVEARIPSMAQDENAKTVYSAILLGDSMTYFDLPNAKLLEKFITNLRAQPEALSLDKRIMFTMILAQGVDYHLSKSEMESRDFEPKYGIAPIDPTWTDDGKTIAINYYQMKVEGMQISTPQKCHVVIDETMKATISCENIVKP